MLHEADARGVGELLGEQGVQERDDAAEHVGEHGQRQLDAEQDEEVVDEAAGEPSAEAALRMARGGEPQDLVDDQLADEQRGHGQERARQPAREVGGSEPRARPPDQLQERRQVAQRAEPLAERARRGARPAAAPPPAPHSRGGASAHGILTWHPLRMPQRSREMAASDPIRPRSLRTWTAVLSFVGPVSGLGALQCELPSS